MHRSRDDAFRHRAAVIITHRTVAGHVYHSLTLPLAPVIASEAKQSRAANQKLDCFVAALLAMTMLLKTRAAPQMSSAMDCGRCFDARATR